MAPSASLLGAWLPWSPILVDNQNGAPNMEQLLVSLLFGLLGELAGVCYSSGDGQHRCQSACLLSCRPAPSKLQVGCRSSTPRYGYPRYPLPLVWLLGLS